MSAPTLQGVAERLSQLSRDLDAKTGEAERLDDKAVRARHAYEIAYANAFLHSTGSVDARKHHAVIATDMEKLDAEIADQVLRACRAAPSAAPSRPRSRWPDRGTRREANLLAVADHSPRRQDPTGEHHAPSSRSAPGPDGPGAGG